MIERPFVVVEWNDAWVDDDNFVTVHGALQTHHPMVVQTFGWVIIDNETGLRVANERSLDDGNEVYRGLTFVPRAMIRSITPYKLVKPRQPKKSLETPNPLKEQ